MGYLRPPTNSFASKLLGRIENTQRALDEINKHLYDNKELAFDPQIGSSIQEIRRSLYLSNCHLEEAIQKIKAQS